MLEKSTHQWAWVYVLLQPKVIDLQCNTFPCLTVWPYTAAGNNLYRCRSLRAARRHISIHGIMWYAVKRCKYYNTSCAITCYYVQCVADSLVMLSKGRISKYCDVCKITEWVIAVIYIHGMFIVVMTVHNCMHNRAVTSIWVWVNGDLKCCTCKKNVFATIILLFLFGWFFHRSCHASILF